MSDAHWIVSREEAGLRLDKFLASEGRLGSRSRAVAAIERGKVFIGDVEATTADAATRVAAGSRVRVWMDRPGSARRRPAPHRTAELDILYEDDDLIAINKPAGLLAVPLERKFEADSVLEQIERHLRSHRTRRPFVVHRIDRDTSGVVLFAKHAAAQAVVKQQLFRHEPERIYHAVVYGHPKPASGTWRDHLAWDERLLIQKQTDVRDARAKEAVSEYRSLESFVATSLIEVRLITGKRNQIRIQARLRGHTLVGESRYTYGPDQLRTVDFGRQALHAARLTIVHPGKGKPLAFEAPMPSDMKDLLKELRAEQVSARR